MDKENRKISTKKMLKVVVMIYLASFFIINWNDVSWIFNYKEVSGLVSDFFNPYPSIDASTINAYFPANQSQIVAQQPPTTTGTVNIKTSFTDKPNTLEIPKIAISVPIIFSTSTDKTALAKDLDKGVVYYPGSVYPGQAGQIIVLGHSAPPNWPKIKHDWVFSNLEKLEVGDTVMVNVNGRQYIYVVKLKRIIERGAEVPQDNLSAGHNVLTLISCWPPGKDYQRIVVQSELID